MISGCLTPGGALSIAFIIQHDLNNTRKVWDLFETYYFHKSENAKIKKIENIGTDLEKTGAGK